ncbi:MAG TPA: hypothetical protein VGP79_09900, partial [Bryobacteraceae bacterium]|nr:hypothetical protein [Bryobacteraceae bacterium]
MAKIEEYRRKGGKVLDLRGRAVEDAGGELAKLHPPDFATGNPAIGFVHRKFDFGDVYFVANTNNRTVKLTTTKRGLWIDLFDQARSSLSLTELRPYESRVLIAGGGTVQGFGDESYQVPTIELSNWSSRFVDLGFTANINPPRSWTDDERTLFYSGTTIYETTVPITRDPGARRALSFGEGTPVEPERRPNGMRALLESPVREAAQVYINGQFAGSVWHPPYEVDVSKFLRVGENQIRIVVANTAINALAGQSLPDYKLLNLRYTERFTPQDMKDLKPLPSGILGPVKLVSR